MQQIKHGIYFEDGYLGVTLGALAFSHGTILIDAPLRPEDARSWRAALLNQRSGSGRMMIALDAHLDRTLGARALECTILTHQKTAQVFRSRPMIFKGQTIESGADWETYHEAIGTRWVSPDITFSDQMILHWGGPKVVLEHHPGPSAGGIWVIIPEEKVVFIGDSVVSNQPPFLMNADLSEWSESLQLLASNYRDYTIISGRSGLIDLNAVKAQNTFIKNLAKKLDRLAEKNSPPETTEVLIPGLLAQFTYPPDHEEKFTQRLHSGLYQYFIRRYRPAESIEEDGLEEEPE